MPFVKNEALKTEIIDSIFRAFYLKKMKYTHRLVYDHPDVPKSMNNAAFEGEVQTLSEENQAILEQIPSHVPPILIKTSEITGFYVEAAQDIPSLTLLCEYAGQVRTAFQTRTSTNDSIMELLSASGNHKSTKSTKGRKN